jgi:hypothetical protein
MHEKSNEIPPIPNKSVQQPLNGVISFRISQIIKGSKNTRFKDAVGKKAGKKKKKGGQKKVLTFCLCLQLYIYIIVGEDLENNDVETRDEHADPNQITVRHYLFS